MADEFYQFRSPQTAREFRDADMRKRFSNAREARDESERRYHLRQQQSWVDAISTHGKGIGALIGLVALILWGLFFS